MILAPGPFQAIYIAAAGSVALAVIPGLGDRQKSDVVLSADPWAVAYRRDRAVEFVFWYADARAADRARGLFLPQYLGGADPADIARMIFRSGGPRSIPHATMIAAAESTIAEIDRRFEREKAAGGMAAINAAYKEYRISQWAANEPAKSYSDYIDDLKAAALRRAVAKS